MAVNQKDGGKVVSSIREVPEIQSLWRRLLTAIIDVYANSPTPRGDPVRPFVKNTKGVLAVAAKCGLTG